MNSIPVFEVHVPSYTLPILEDNGEEMEYAGTPWYNIKIPKVYWDNRPDFDKIAHELDQCLKNHFMGQKIALRALSAAEHPDKTVDELVEIIQRIGHDRYDPNRKGNRYENIENRHIDFFAIPFEVNEEETYFEHLIRPFYFWPVSDGKEPVRLDIAIIFDLEKLNVVEHRYEGRENEVKRDGFAFKDSERKTEAVLGLIKISR